VRGFLIIVCSKCLGTFRSFIALDKMPASGRIRTNLIIDEQERHLEKRQPSQSPMSSRRTQGSIIEASVPKNVPVGWRGKGRSKKDYDAVGADKGFDKSSWFGASVQGNGQNKEPNQGKEPNDSGSGGGGRQNGNDAGSNDDRPVLKNPAMENGEGYVDDLSSFDSGA
jgi:hypothetical protein